MAEPLETSLAAKYGDLKRIISSYESAIVAFSAGIDSSLVAFVAGQMLGQKALAITSGSLSLKRKDLALAHELAQKWGLEHRVVMTDEIAKADYRANPVNRCFHCKTSLYTLLKGVADQENYAALLNGTNLDDLGDHRPGLIAADNHRVRSPLVDAGFRKADVRALARWLGLENSEKPQAACLSSRFPYGTAITESLLAQVEQSEDFLASIGLSQYRVRHHGDIARIEVTPEELPLLMAHRVATEEALKSFGYLYVAVDLGGFRSGSLNEALRRRGDIPVVQLHAPSERSD
ncbi:MAG: ATP-dependent sacrificial sulfur transferase LarE [Gammaproteobacteria bacterium]|nr:ATP-dependent sacrificial sulfur transferase LarE [Gammaproteobacteria bacterium]